MTSPPIKIVTGLHPGFLVSRELKKRGIPVDTFAIAVLMDKDKLLEILSGQHPVNQDLADRIESYFEWEPGLLTAMQANISKAPVEEISPLFKKIRKILFWDTETRFIDPEKHCKAIVIRVFTRGNEFEKKLILDFYGQNRVKTILSNFIHS